MTWQGVLHAYSNYLPFGDDVEPVSLYEGNTPLTLARRLAGIIAPKANLNLYLKYEGLNPTGSFKDRGMTAAITQAVHEGAKTVICASTGNTAASAAAYAARAGRRCAPGHGQDYRKAGDDSLRHSHRQPGPLAAGAPGA